MWRQKKHPNKRQRKQSENKMRKNNKDKRCVCVSFMKNRFSVQNLAPVPTRYHNNAIIERRLLLNKKKSNQTKKAFADERWFARRLL